MKKEIAAAALNYILIALPPKFKGLRPPKWVEEILGKDSDESGFSHMFVHAGD